jgi:hypothetical protein
MIRFTLSFWQKIGLYECEVIADYDEDGHYVPGSTRYSGRHRQASY